MSEAAHLEEHTEDPLEGDVDRFVHPDETRTDEQIAHDKEYAVEPYDDGIVDEDEPEDEPTPKAEDKYDFTEKDREDRSAATTWLTDAADSYEKQAEKFGRVKGDSNQEDVKGVSAYAQMTGGLSAEAVAESKALNRVLENGFYATSDDNVYSALRTIETGTIRRAGYFSTWQDGSYKAAENIQTTELDLDGLREFTDKFAELQRQREAAIAEGSPDPLHDQMQKAFTLDRPPTS